MDRQPTLEGEHLLLRPLRADDHEALFAVAADRAIWAQHPAHDRWQAPVFRVFFDDALARGGALAIVEKASGKLVGSSRFQGHTAAAGGSVEIGWTFLARRLWGSGANAELKRLMLNHAFRSIRQVRFTVGEDNIISRRALAKIGAAPTGETIVKQMAGGAARHLVYAIERT